jgi:Lrp/AsnC family transcriptional regulator, leucine-responsive regulatory protein
MDKLDKLDIQIIDILQSEGRIPVTQIGARIDVPHTTVRDRIQRLEEEDVIERYAAVINPAKVGYLISCLVHVTMEQKMDLEETISVLRGIDEVTEFLVLTGGTDIAVRVYSRDIDHLRDIIYRKIKSIPGFIRSNTQVVLASGTTPITFPVEQDEG